MDTLGDRVCRLHGGERVRYPDARTIHLVLDNLNTHSRKALVKRHGELLGGLLSERVTIHYTRKHGSWLNLAEIEVRLLTRSAWGNARIPDLNTLGGEVGAWAAHQPPHTITDWKFTRKQTLSKFHYSITRTRF